MIRTWIFDLGIVLHYGGQTIVRAATTKSPTHPSKSIHIQAHTPAGGHVFRIRGPGSDLAGQPEIRDLQHVTWERGQPETSPKRTCVSNVTSRSIKNNLCFQCRHRDWAYKARLNPKYPLLQQSTPLRQQIHSG